MAGCKSSASFFFTLPAFSEQWLGNDRLFIGLELSHDTQGSGKLPSVVGMAYTFNETLSMTGHYFYVDQGKNIISNLASQLETPILEYKGRSKSRRWPSHVFVYRSGVSDGEYTQGLLLLSRHPGLSV